MSGPRDQENPDDLGSDETALHTDTIANADGSVTIVVKGEVDAATSDQFAAAMRQPPPTNVVRVDLSGVSFMDSSGLNALVTARHEYESRSGRLVVAGDTPNIRRLFELAGLSEMFECEPPNS